MPGLLVLATVVLALSASACGAETTVSPEPNDVVSPELLARAADRAKAIGTSRFAFTGKMSLEGMSRPVSFDGVGIFDFKRYRGRTTWNFTDFAEEAGYDAEAEEFVGELLFIGDRLLVRVPFFTDNLPGAKPWIEFGRDNSVDTAADELMGAAGGDDPSRALSLIKAASDDVRDAGTDEVRGVETTHYIAEVDLARAVDAAPKRDRPSLRRSLERLRRAGAQTIVPVEVWVDRDGLARRVRQSWPVVNDETLEMTCDYFDFGVEVVIKAPPPQQIMSENAFDALLEVWE